MTGQPGGGYQICRHKVLFSGICSVWKYWTDFHVIVVDEKQSMERQLERALGDLQAIKTERLVMSQVLLHISMAGQPSGVIQKLTYWVWLSVSQGASLADFLSAPAHPIEKVTLWVSFLYLNLGSGVVKDNIFARTGNQTPDSGFKARYDSTRLSFALMSQVNNTVMLQMQSPFEAISV